jgi:NADH-quinone oxidoreductase subunit G
LGDLIMLDMERCVICARCTRFQQEIAFDPVLAIEERGRYAHIVSYSDPPFDSHYSGNTTDICPVGALTSRDFRFGARAWELTNVPSLCNHCGVGCNMILGTRTDQIKRVMPRQNEAVNEIWLCDKGRFAHHFNGSPQRLTSPLVRKDGRLVEASWSEALSRVAHRFEVLKTSHGPQSLGGIAGARLSNEDLYLFQKFFRQVIGSPNIDHRVGLSAVFSDETAYTVGVGRGTDLGRLGKGSTVLVFGADLDQETPILYLRLAGAATKRRAQVINAGGRKTKLDGQATTSLRYRYGGAAHLAWGLVAAVIRQGLTNDAWLSGRTSGLAELEQALQAYSPEQVAERSGVTVAAIEAAAKSFAEAENGIIIYGMEAGHDPAVGAALQALALVTGHAGKADNGLIAILPQANSRGAADMGVVPERLPGYRPVEGEAGLPAQAMLLGQSGLKGLLIAGADPAAESEAYRASLAGLDFLVVQELFLTETAKLAEVVLPARATAERDGTFTNLERRVQTFDAAVPPAGQAWADWLILTAMAGRMGATWSYASADGVMAEISREVPLYQAMQFENLVAPVSLARKTSHYIYEGMSFTAEVREGLQWPALAEDEAAQLPLTFVAPAEPEAETGLILVAPRRLYDGGRLLAEAEILQPRLSRAEVLLSGPDGERLGVSNGQTVALARNGVWLTLPVRLERSVPAGVALLPRNLAGRPAEQLLGPTALYAAVKIEKVVEAQPVAG